MTESLAFIVPILPGKESKFRDNAEMMTGSKQTEHTESRGALNLTKQDVFLQTTPQGSIVLVYTEGPGATDFRENLMKSDRAYDKWFVEQLGEVHGVGTPASAPPKNERRVAYNGEGTSNSSICFAVPVKHLEDWKHFADEINGTKREAHASSRRRHGIIQEHVFLQTNPDGQSWVIVYMQGDNVDTFMQRISKSDDAFDKWFMEQITHIHGIDFSQPMPAPERVMHWEAEPVAAR